MCRYSDVLRQPLAVTLAVLTAWYFSFLIIFIIPIDVSNTIYRKFNCTNNTLNPEEFHSVDQSNILFAGTTLSNESSTTSPTTTSTTTTTESSTERPAAPCPAPPASLVSGPMLYSLWLVVYWSSAGLTWLLLPVMQSLSQAGEFTFLARLKSALWDNTIFYARSVLSVGRVSCSVPCSPPATC